jgi:hypothetical protein
MDTDALLAAIRAGDRNPFGEIVDVYESPLACYLFLLIGEAVLSEKLVTATLVCVYQAILKGTPENLPELICRTATDVWKDTFPHPAWYKRRFKNKR